MLHFEKQVKQGQRSDYADSVLPPSRYPSFVLVFNDDWNDFKYKTWFSLFYFRQEEQNYFLGELKIIAEDGVYDIYHELPEHWDGELDERFCSIGIDDEYYARIRDIIVQRSWIDELLHNLRDCAVNPLVKEVFEETEAYRASILRDQTTEKALENAQAILSGLNYEDFYSINYRFTPDFDDAIDTDLAITFQFRPQCYLRASAIIGENGVLKTSMLSGLVRDLKDHRDDVFHHFPQFSSYIALYSTEQDKYPDKDEDNDYRPYFPCCLEQDTPFLNEKLKVAIRTIVARKPVRRIEMAQMYQQLVDEHVGEIADGLFNEVDENGQDIRLVFCEAAFDEMLPKFSSGQLHIFAMLTFMCANVHLSSLFIIDEPEVHLHPHTIMNFVALLCDVLDKFESYAVIATHSPLIVRELVRQNVFLMHKVDGTIPVVDPVAFDTFGEDISTLYHKIFEYDEQESFFRKIVKGYVKEELTCQEIIELLSKHMDLNLNAKLTIRDMEMEYRRNRR